MKWDKLAEKYDELWVQKYSLLPTRREILKRIYKIRPKSILDVGCGTGQLLEEICKGDSNIALYGIDYSPEMIEKAESKGINAIFSCENISFVDEKDSREKVEMICCSHSFPYYHNKEHVVSVFESLLTKGGVVICVQSCDNNLFDKIVLRFVEKTATKAEYLSSEKFKKLFFEKFAIVEEFKIKEKWYMPSICGFVMTKRR